MIGQQLPTRNPGAVPRFLDRLVGRRWRRPTALILAGALFAGAPAHANSWVHILLSERKPANLEFSAALQKSLKRVAPAATVLESDTPETPPEGKKAVVVVVGPRALPQAVARPGRGPLVAALISRASYEKEAGRAPASITGVFLDQPEERQLALLSLLPHPPQSVGIVRSANSGVSLSRLRAAAATYKQALIVETVAGASEVGPAMQKVIGQSDLILATPDPEVYSPQTIQSILLGAYRAKVPLIGFSPAYTRAGALLSLHSSVGQLAEQTADLVGVVLAGGAAPAAQAPRHYEISVNRQVARSLGIDLPDEAELTEALRQHEKGRSP